jgi:hypothetical protein
LLAIGATAVEVDHLEQTAEATELTDGRRVGATDDGTTEDPQAD